MINEYMGLDEGQKLEIIFLQLTVSLIITSTRDELHYFIDLSDGKTRVMIAEILFRRPSSILQQLRLEETK